MDIFIVSLFLLATLFFLVTEKISVDLTAVGLMVLLVVSGLLTPHEAVAGFANPALITIAAMLLFLTMDSNISRLNGTSISYFSIPFFLPATAGFFQAVIYVNR